MVSNPQVIKTSFDNIQGVMQSSTPNLLFDYIWTFERFSHNRDIVILSHKRMFILLLHGGGLLVICIAQTTVLVLGPRVYS